MASHGGLLTAQSRTSRLTAPFIDELCNVVIDYEFQREQLRRQAAAAGEEGRVILLQAARSDAGYRECAWDYLVYLGEGRLVPVLLDVINSETEPPAIRVKAAAKLAGLDPEGAVPRLEIFLGTEDPEIQRVAIVGLGQTRHVRAKQVLREKLEQTASDDRSSREVLEREYWLVLALGKQGDPADVPLLLKVLKNNGVSGTTRYRVALAMVDIGTRESLANVAGVIETMPSPLRSSAILEVLSLLRDQVKKSEDASLTSALNETIDAVEKLK